MATGLIPQVERRSGTRVSPAHTVWQPLALLRPGQEVCVVNFAPGGALLESASRMKPGARTELQLFGGVRWQVRGRIERCRVACLRPLRYEAVLIFEEPLDLAVATGG